jgi:signal peptidase II
LSFLALSLPDRIARLFPAGRFSGLPAPEAGAPLSVIFSLELSRNPGIAFSLLAREGGTAATLLGALLLGIVTIRLCSPRARLALALLWGGALGNGIDRIRFGAVRDWIVLTLVPTRTRLALNLADLAILSGGVLLMTFLLRGSSPSGEETAEPGSPPRQDVRPPEDPPIRHSGDAGTRWESPPRSP